jgi:hypothetical protein
MPAIEQLFLGYMVYEDLKGREAGGFIRLQLRFCFGQSRNVQSCQKSLSSRKMMKLAND